MKHYLLAMRYAGGLLRCIDAPAEMERVQVWLRAFARMYAESADLQTAMTNPAIPAEQRRAALQAVLTHSAAPDTAAKLLNHLFDKGRIAHLGDVATAFGILSDERLNRVRATVISAQKMDEALESRLRAALERFTGKTVRLECAVDPQLLGGAVASVDGKLIDGSVRGRLRRLEAALIEEEGNVG